MLHLRRQNVTFYLRAFSYISAPPFKTKHFLYLVPPFEDVISIWTKITKSIKVVKILVFGPIFPARNDRLKPMTPQTWINLQLVLVVFQIMFCPIRSVFWSCKCIQWVCSVTSLMRSLHAKNMGPNTQPFITLIQYQWIVQILAFLSEKVKRICPKTPSKKATFYTVTTDETSDPKSKTPEPRNKFVIFASLSKYTQRRAYMVP